LDAVTTPDPQYPSLALVLDLLRSGQAERRAHVDALDQKAGLALGFAGVLVTLSEHVAEPWRALGAVAAVIAAGLALWSFWPRQWPTPGRARKYLDAPIERTQAALVDALDALEVRADLIGRTKARRLKAALVTLATAVLMLGIGVVATGSRRP
jgi:hypothetical protein